jgi:3',5'-cyclic-AMP phosphodiesterase
MAGVTHPSPTCTLVQLTDLHLVADGEELPNGVDTAAVLEEALRAVEDAAIRPTALVLTGDLTEHGRPEQYRRLRGIVEPAAARLGAALVYAAGNHDDRAAMREHLMDDPPSGEPLDHTVRAGALRIVVLDSTVPEQGHGELRPEQLDRLRAELAEPAPAGTVLALHHPPLPSAAPLASAIRLLRREDLADAVAGTDVRLVLAGHTHVVSAGMLGGVPVWTRGPARDGARRARAGGCAARAGDAVGEPHRPVPRWSAHDERAGRRAAHDRRPRRADGAGPGPLPSRHGVHIVWSRETAERRRSAAVPT